MRGKPTEDFKIKVRRRITPAHAGKTIRSGEEEHLFEDHPRACGENTSETAYFRG